MIQEALNVTESVEELSNISSRKPCSLADGATSAPFSAEQPKAKMQMKKADVYSCGHNVFLASPLHDAALGALEASHPASALGRVGNIANDTPLR